MLLLQVVFFFFLGFGRIESLEEMRLCPACIDDKYIKFFPNNLNLFYKSNRSYSYHYGLEKHKCIDNSYKKIQCVNSCIRIHLQKVEQSKNKTIGWLFDCSTNIVLKVPATVTGVPENLRNFQGDLKFVDYLNEGSVRAALDVQFYSVSFDVETAEDYYRRQNIEKLKQSSEKQDCERYPFKCWIGKNFEIVHFLCGGLVMTIFSFLLITMRYYCVSMMQAHSNNSTARVRYERNQNGFDNVTLFTDDQDNNDHVLESV